MNANLLYNKELDNYKEQDTFNFITKAEAIKAFLESNSTALEKNKMLALYGDWGSGKTSLMRYVESTINKGIYKPIFFHAWEHEKDDNLALSLCDALIECVMDTKSEIVKNFMKGALATLRGFTNGITFKPSGVLQKIGLEAEFSGKDFLEEFDKAFEKSDDPSFYVKNKEFKETFIKVEEEILSKFNAQKILIFVDDLDRCEPENVLNLITALKLFFTYGNKTVFFCGVDKEAVTKAVKTKYKDVIKSEEYMEKVFDITFNMPKVYSLTKIISPYFIGSEHLRQHQGDNYYKTIEVEHREIIEDFFQSINFSNPRHLKKVINKYQILKSYKNLNTLPYSIKKLVPNVIDEGGNGNYLETILSLFFIILYEFNVSAFKEIEQYDKKLQTFFSPVLENATNNNAQSVQSSFNTYYYIEDIKTKTINDLFESNNLKTSFIRFLILLSPSSPKHFALFNDDNLERYASYFDGGDTLSAFCRFLTKHKDKIVMTESNYIFWNYFEMVKYLL